MEKFESSIKTINWPLETVYTKMADLNNLQSIKSKVADPNFMQAARSMGAAEKLDEDKLNKLVEVLGNMTCDTDTVSINVSPVGNITLRIIEREENKTIKFETASSPIPFNMWIQLLPTDASSCKMKLTIKAELNFFMRKMVEKPLKQGIESVAEMLSKVPYGA